MSQTEVSVLIKARDDAKAAFQAAEKALRTVGAAAADTSIQVTAFRERMRELKAQHDLGQLSSTQYANALKTLRADMASLAQTTTLTARSQQQLGQISAMAESQITGMGRGMRRSKDGIEALAMSAGGMALAARGSVGALSGVFSQLQLVAISNPWLVGILGGLSAIAAAYAAIADSAHDAAAGGSDFSRFRVTRPGLTDTQKQREVAGMIAQRERDLSQPLALRQGQLVTRQTKDGPVEFRVLSGADEEFNRNLVQRRALLQDELSDLRAIEASNRTALTLIRQQNAAKAEAARERDPWRNARAEGTRPTFRDLNWEQVQRESDRRSAERAKQEREELMASTAWMRDPATVLPEGFGDAMDAQFERMRLGWQMIRDELKETQAAYQRYGGYVVDVMEAGGAAVAAHQNVVNAMLGATLKAIAQEMRIRAAKEVAEAAIDAAAWNWAAAGAHMRAAAIAGAVAGLAGGVAGNLSAGAGGGSSPAGPHGTPSSAPSVVVIQILGQTTGQVVQETTYDLARYQALGGRAPGSSVVHLPVSGVIVAGAG